MSDTAIISGDFCTFRHVQGRKVLQIVIEVPAEAAGSVFAKLGMPGSGEGIPVAVARLAPTYTTPEPGKTTSDTGPVTRRFSELPYSQQAALRCNESLFQKFLIEAQAQRWRRFFNACEGNSEATASSVVREFCAVTSRSEIAENNQAGSRWRELEAEYYAWQRGRR